MRKLFRIEKFHVLSRFVGCGYKGLQKNKVDANILWSELDENLLGEIMSRLSPTDQARFHAVCKRWHSVRPITTYKSLPWFACTENYPSLLSNSFKFHLYDPYSSPRFRISTCKIPLISKLSFPSSLLTLLYATTVRHNWLFTSVCQLKWSGALCYKCSFLISPFTRSLIQLPKLDYEFSMSSSFFQLFSTNPMSLDCVFVISINSYDVAEYVVMTCRQGDTEWTVRKFDNFLAGFCIAEYINGTVFAVSSYGQVALYNVMTGEFEIEKLDSDDDFDQLYDSQLNVIIFELNGDLAILYIGFSEDHVRGDNNTFPDIPCIKKFDRHIKAWVPLRSLGDQTLFVGDSIGSIAKVGMEQARNMGVLSNAIYYYFDLGCIIYSFENGVLVQLKYNAASKNIAVKTGDLLQLHYNSAIRDKKHFYFWLEPPAI